MHLVAAFILGLALVAQTTVALASSAEPGRAKRWREAPDSWVGTQRSAIVAFPSRRAVGAKNAPRDRRRLAQGLCQVFTEGRGTTETFTTL